MTPVRRAGAAAVCGFALVVAASCTDSGRPRDVATLPPSGPTEVTTAPTAANPTSTVRAGKLDRASAFNGRARWQPPSLGWTGCPTGAAAERGLECATLAVPRDWSAPDGPTVTLALARAATSGPSRIGALVTNPGGPGASGIEFLASAPFPRAVTDRFDVVSWDPRGVGASTRLRCGGPAVETFLHDDPSPDDDAEQRAIDEHAEALSADCGRLDADLLPHMSTADTVFDLDAIRAALGEATISFMGFSYGTLIGQLYADWFPTGLRALVLDAVVDPAQDFSTFLLDQSAAFDRSLRALLDRCPRTSRCPLGADPWADATTVAREVETGPLPARSGYTVGPAEVAAAFTEAPYGTTRADALWSAIHDALSGDGDGLLDLAEQYYDAADFTAYLAVVCSDSPHPVGALAYRDFVRSAAEVSELMGPGIANELLPCATWPAPVDDVTGEVHPAGPVPTLVLGNTGDPATPYPNSIAVAKRFAGAALVTYRGEAHGSYGFTSCVDDVVHRALIDLTLPSSDPDCR